MNQEFHQDAHARTDPPVSPGEPARPLPEGAVAIIGMAGRFPGAPNLETFWRNLVERRDTITRFTAADSEQTNFDATTAADFVGARGVLDSADLFDADFFGIPPREAGRMDPQHRVFLETCEQALENAGYGARDGRGEVGLWAGASLNTYLLHNLAHDRSFVEEFASNYQVNELTTLFGNDKDFLTTRAAYKLDLRGPVMSVQGACATSLVAVCQAAQSLLNFGCDMALAGGVSISFPQRRGHIYSEGSLASRDGLIRPFDAEATGTVFGHGCGVVVLKRLEDAVRDSDTIAAVLRGFAVTNDGAGKAGYMAPGIDGQARAIAAAQAMAQVLPEDISYIEAHGTGTPLGDPIELAALNRAFADNGCMQSSFCQIGAAKGNVGHLDAAAGVTGLIKTVLQLQHRYIPGLAHFTTPNPRLELDGSPFFFSGVGREWTSEGPRRAGVSAFGVGGVNAHIIVEEASAQPLETASSEVASSDPVPLCLSARSQQALEQAARELADHLEAHPETSLEDAAYTLAAGRTAYPLRLAVPAASHEAAVTALRSASATAEPSRSRRIAFAFPGQGSQFAGMGRELYEREPLYRGIIDHGAAVAQPELVLDLRTLLFPATEDTESAQAELQKTHLAQPALFLTSYAVARLWQSWGVEPELTVGHSVGEFVSATLAGVMSVDDALRLLCLRGWLMGACEPGTMVSVPLDEAALAPYLSERITISALNSGRSSVLGGPFDAVEELETRLAADGIAARRLRTSHAFHSPMMDAVVERFAAVVAAIELRAPATPYISTITGRRIDAHEATEPRFWASQCTLPVRFTEAMSTLRAEGIDLILECGPGEALTALARHAGAGNAPSAAFFALPTLGVPCKNTAPAACRNAASAQAELWVAGGHLDWQAVFADLSRQRVPLPTYPFERKRFWIDPPVPSFIPPTQLPTRDRAETNTVLEPQPMSIGPTPPSRLPRLAQEIATVFADLSGIDITPAEHDVSFLELGLDSLFLTQATLGVSKRFSVKVTFRQLTEQFPTVAALAGHLDATMPPDAVEIPAPVAAIAPQAAPAMAVMPSVAVSAEGTVQALFAQQVAALTNLFQQQIAALHGAASVTPMQAAALAPQTPVTAATAPAAKSAAPVVAASEQRHGSFRPPVTKTSDVLEPRQLKYISDLITAYNAKTPGSKQRTDAHRPHLSDPRAVSGFRPQWKEMVYPLVTDRARGSRLWDVDGNEYIDIVNGYGCIMFGHSPDFIVEALKQQLDLGVAIGPQSVLAGEVAKLITELTGNERVTFCNTGSEAVMAAIRVARTVTGRDKFVYFAGDYHGTFDEVLMRQTPRGAAAIAPGIPAANTTNVIVLEYGAPASMEWIRANADEIAAVLIEPVQTRHPDNQPMQFIKDLRALSTEKDICFILDEVVTGFRLAPGGVQEMLGIRADMATYGKVIGGGHPIGVLSGKAQFLDALDGGAWRYGDASAPEVGVTFFAGTFVRHPLALAATKSVLQHLKAAGPHLQAELNRKTRELAQRLDAFFVERGVPARIDSFASWFYWTFPSEVKLGSLFYYAMRAKGIHIQEGYPCFLTTAHTEADIEAIERAFRETIVEMQEAGALPGSSDTPTPQPPKAFVEPEPVAAETSSRSTSSRKQPAMHPEARTSVPARIPMTEPQREIYLAAALSDDANCAFNESLTLHLRGPLREKDLCFALDAVIARHDALRSHVCSDGEALCVDPAFAGVCEFDDLRSLARIFQEGIIAERTAVEARMPFDLHEGPLFRMQGFRLTEDETLLLIVAHHMVMDGWSANQFLEEVGAIYSNGPAGLTELTPLLPFSSYALRETERETRGDFAQNERYWVEMYTGRSPRLDLPTDRPRPIAKSYRGATLEGSLRSGMLAELKKMSAKNGASLFVTLLSGFQLLLHHLTHQDEVVVGISTAGQSLIEEASLVGHCVHFLPMLSTLHEKETAQSHIKKTRTAVLDAQEHSEFTYGSLVRKLPLERDPSRLPLIEVQFNLERVGANVRFEGVAVEMKANPKAFVNTDLFLNVVETPGDLGGLIYALDYNTDLFDESTVRRWMSHYEQLLEGELRDVTTPVARLPLLTGTEREQILRGWNQTSVDLGTFAPVHESVLRFARTEPHRIAIESGARQWTYVDLAEYATLLAKRLVHGGIKPGQLVGICIERSLEMAGAMLAVMMAGAAYVPLDPRHPRERLQTIISDAGISMLLTGRDPSIDTDALILTITGPQPRHEATLPHAVASTDLAYVIYTSGSTGKPKGVAIEHRALMNLLLSMESEPGLTRDDVLVAITTLAFDIAALEILLPLMVGARLVIATDEQVVDGNLLLELIQDAGATTLQATPGAWRILLDAGWTSADPLKALCGGEALPRDLADELLSRASSVWNVYGPTETTIWSSATKVTEGTEPLRVGPPIANTQFYVLSSELEPTPIGVVGELMVGGDGLARGYWNRPVLTAENFIPNPFGEGRIYRTGDLGRFHPDGTVELLGRADFQVKIRGYRIELGEIESALAKHKAVREAIVLAQAGPNGVSHLLGFADIGRIISDDDTGGLIRELHDHLHRILPAYMVPPVMLPLPAFPRLPNGKVDRRALLALGAQDSSASSAKRAFTAPQSEPEMRLARIWADVLGTAEISVTDSIFELGGDSLAIFRIAAKATHDGLPLQAATIFEHRTVQAICAHLYGRQAIIAEPKAQSKRIGAAPRQGYRLVK